jgi:metal-responsive CopG/Arc/MetJ family transcriptional regulator
MAKTAQIIARVDEEMVNALDEIVMAGPGDRSDHIRQALSAYIQEQRRKQKFLQALAVADGERAPA